MTVTVTVPVTVTVFVTVQDVTQWDLDGGLVPLKGDVCIRFYYFEEDLYLSATPIKSGQNGSLYEDNPNVSCLCILSAPSSFTCDDFLACCAKVLHIHTC